ncbi:hypothetical protein GCM10010156_45620 [Planobispora rosea]|uniref:DUF4190 domain-containing protein n=1 Tax=Planobispora rosea TaxID=35762 RepID=A0A8J3WE92_PLARO|nr:hypothetical protein [Planobispora rosea]GGS81765.1 hypothetical protein GCM10010156_45620 [Planobispora rosea]GIH86105.1 hypothetical protein Pro02_45130 [Planobispora rosea]
MTTPVQLRPAEGAGRRALWLAFAAVVLTFVLPLAGVVMSLFALVVSIRAIPTLKLVSKPTGAAVAGIVLSSLALLVSLSVTALQFYLSDELSAYAECKIGAGTVTAQNECVERLERAMEKRFPFVEPGSLEFPFPP